MPTSKLRSDIRRSPGAAPLGGLDSGSGGGWKLIKASVPPAPIHKPPASPSSAPQTPGPGRAVWYLAFRPAGTAGGAANRMPKGYFGEYLTLAFFAGMMILLVVMTLGLNRLVHPKVHR